MFARTRRFIGCIAVTVAAVASSGTRAAHADPPAAPPDAEPAVVAGTGGATGALTSGWKIQSSAVAPGTGATISDPAYPTAGWLPISKPETLMAALVENGRYPNVFYSNNLASVPSDQFAVNWWYRQQTRLHPRRGEHTFLAINGGLSRANLWVNGTKVADQAQLQGAYSRFEYDITGLVRDGDNAIALDVFKNDASNSTGYLTLDMVDWNPRSPDNWTGLQFAPQLIHDGAVAVRNAHVVQNYAPDLGSSDLTVKADLRNNTATPQTTDFSGTIDGPRAKIRFNQRVTIPANSTVPVTVAPVHLDRPAVWWPYQMGDQPLYHLAVSARLDRDVSDRAELDFGIRTVTSYLTPVVPGQTIAPEGYRQFVINGRPLVVRRSEERRVGKECRSRWSPY